MVAHWLNLVMVTCGFWTVVVGCCRAETEAEAIAALREVRCRVGLDPNGHAVYVGIGDLIVDVDVKDADLVHLRSLPFLETLELFSDNITDDGLRHLTGITTIKRMLFDTAFTEEGWKHCTGLTSLEDLFIHGPGLNGSGLRYFKDSTRLKILYVSDLRDRDLEHLLPFTSLADLMVPYSYVTDAGLIYLGQLPALKNLWLRAPAVCGPGIVHLSKLTHLEDLSLQGGDLFDIAVPHFANLKSLKRLDLAQCYVNFDLLDEVARGLPNAEIYRAPGAADEQRSYFDLRQDVTRLRTGEDPKTGRINELRFTVTSEFQLEDLRKFTALAQLELSEYHDHYIQDSDVPFFISLKTLTSLKFVGTRLTAEGLKRLREGLPMCQVEATDIFGRPQHQ